MLVSTYILPWFLFVPFCSSSSSHFFPFLSFRISFLCIAALSQDMESELVHSEHSIHLVKINSERLWWAKNNVLFVINKILFCLCFFPRPQPQEEGCWQCAVKWRQLRYLIYLFISFSSCLPSFLLIRLPLMKINYFMLHIFFYYSVG